MKAEVSRVARSGGLALSGQRMMKIVHRFKRFARGISVGGANAYDRLEAGRYLQQTRAVWRGSPWTVLRVSWDAT
eukprot:6011403-Lingulodinium_polyedra.AAC.1